MPGLGSAKSASERGERPRAHCRIRVNVGARARGEASSTARLRLARPPLVSFADQQQTFAGHRSLRDR